MSRPKAILSWSSGKDSAMALHRTLAAKELEVVCLLTAISDAFHRVSMHGVREELLELQAESVGIQLQKVMIPYPCPNAVYEEKMREVLSLWKGKGITHVIFGDLFLEDIRKYREEKIAQIDLTPVFPVWGKDTATLAREMLGVGFRAIICCVDPRKLDAQFAGREFNSSLLRDLPENVDPCGENGEFHTFVYDGPILKKSIPVQVGERVMRDGFQFADLTART
ncbi:MAG: diphthine--ammonia ligase [Candidatus Bathyarchaeia archaeon]